MKWPNYNRAGIYRREGLASVSNFGDVDAHRVSVHLQRGDYEPQIIATHPMLKPGDKLDFDLVAWGGRAMLRTCG